MSLYLYFLFTAKSMHSTIRHMNLRVLLFKNKPQIRFLNPKKSNLVIYDPVARDVFKEIVSIYNPTYLALSSEIYLPVFIRAFIKQLFQGEKELIDLYIYEFLKFVKPTLVGTNFEIDCRFAYFVSNLGWETFFVQHGIYAGVFVNEDYRSKNGLANVTDMFVFNSSVKEHLKFELNYSGNFHIIGSLIANELIEKTASSDLDGKYLYFVSEWEGADSGLESLEAQKIILVYCQRYCVSRSLVLKILLRHNKSNPKYTEEMDFYSRASAGKVEFASKQTANDNYNGILHAYGVVFLSSTLGYELMLNTHLSVACISFRGALLGLHSEVFGWPVVKDACGLGFTNVITYEEVSRILDDLKHGGISHDTRTKLLAFDSKNTIFKTYLENKLNYQVITS